MVNINLNSKLAKTVELDREINGRKASFLTVIDDEVKFRMSIDGQETSNLIPVRDWLSYPIEFLVKDIVTFDGLNGIGSKFIAVEKDKPQLTFAVSNLGNGIFLDYCTGEQYSITQITLMNRILPPKGDIAFNDFQRDIDRLQVDDFTKKKLLCVMEKLSIYSFFNKPAASGHHHAYKGGLAVHSYELYVSLTTEFNTTWQRNESPMIIALAHDLCKCLIYQEDGTRNKHIQGHGDLSIKLWEELFPEYPLTEEEVVCIEHHMGVYLKDREYCNLFNRLAGQFPNLLFVCAADLRSSTSNSDYNEK